MLLPRFLFASLFCLLPSLLSAAGQPVSVAELDFWLRGGRTSAEIVAEINQRGLLEPVNEDAQRRLRGNGADAALLARVSDASLVVSSDAASQARQELAALAEKDRINRALALQQLREIQPPAAAAPRPAAGGNGGGARPPPSSGEPPAPGANGDAPLEIAPFPEPIGSGADGWKVSYANAVRQAAKEHRMVLVDFSGSDWSAPCQRLEQEVFSTFQFKEFAAQKLILVRLDFPKRSLQAREVREQNAKLAQAFGVNDYPAMFLLSERGEPLTKLSYTRGGPLPFLAKIKAIEAKLKP